MLDEKQRRSIGQEVKSIALHYYIGLAGMSEKEAEKAFLARLVSNDAIAISALRLAEREAMAGADQI